MDPRIPALALAGVLLAPAPLRATTYCVHDEAEFRTALGAAAHDTDDDTIKLARGVYHANGQPFAYTAASTHAPAIAGGFDANCASRIRNPALTVLDGDRLSGVFASYSLFGSIAIRYVTVQNGVTTGNGGGLYFQHTKNQLGNGNVTVSLDIIRDNQAAFGGGLDAGVGGTGVLRVKNDLFVGNVATRSSGAAELVASGDTRIYVVSNTVVGNSRSGDGSVGGLFIGRDADAAPAVVADNVFWGNSGYDFESGAALELANDFGSAFGAPASGSGGNLSVDPIFASAADFHLQPTSPLLRIGSASPPDGLTDTDLDGHERSAFDVDIGAYERGDAIFADGFE